MIYDRHLIAIEDKLNSLADCILTSNEFSNYQNTKNAIEHSNEVEILVQEFQIKKEVFELIEPYGKHAPDYREKSRELRKAKRALDIHPIISDFRFYENQFQGILDDICLAIAAEISEDIKVDAGNPFFTKHSGCGGNCHAS